MKKLLLLSVISIMLFAGSSWAGQQDFVLVNETGLTIDQFFCSPTTTEDWEEDVLGAETLPDGESIKIEFSTEEDVCEWDLKIIDEDGDEIIWTKINLCKTTKVTLYYEDGKPTAQIEEEQ
jgi:hypothetical protein